MDIRSFDDLKERIGKLETFEFKSRWTSGAILLYLWLGIGVPCVIVFMAMRNGLWVLGILLAIIVFLIFYFWNKGTLIITSKYIEVKGGFSPFKINFSDVHNIEYYIVNDMAPYAKFIMKRGGRHKTSLHSWKNYSSIKVQEFIKEIINFYYRLNNMSK